MKNNKRGVDELYKQMGRKLLTIDEEIRANYTGKPAATIAPVAQRKFSVVGFSLTEGQLDLYAESVEKNEPFEFKLQ